MGDRESVHPSNKHAVRRCVHAPPSCFLAVPNCVHAPSSFVHAPRNCVHVVRSFVHAHRNYVHALRNYVHVVRNCVHALRNYVHVHRNYDVVVINFLYFNELFKKWLFLTTSEMVAVRGGRPQGPAWVILDCAGRAEAATALSGGCEANFMQTIPAHSKTVSLPQARDCHRSPRPPLFHWTPRRDRFKFKTMKTIAPLRAGEEG